MSLEERPNDSETDTDDKSVSQTSSQQDPEANAFNRARQRVINLLIVVYSLAQCEKGGEDERRFLIMFVFKHKLKQ